MAAGGGPGNNSWPSGLDAAAATAAGMQPAAVAAVALPPAPALDPGLLGLLPTPAALLPPGGAPLNDLLLHAYLHQQGVLPPPAPRPAAAAATPAGLGFSGAAPATSAPAPQQHNALSVLASLLCGCGPAAPASFATCAAQAPGFQPPPPVPQAPAATPAAGGPAPDAAAVALLAQLASQAGVSQEDLLAALGVPAADHAVQPVRPTPRREQPGSVAPLLPPAPDVSMAEAAAPGSSPMVNASSGWGGTGPLPATAAVVKQEPAPAAPPMLPVGLPTPQLDVAALQEAARGAGLSPAVAQDAALLLQRIAAAATMPAASRENVANLSIKLFQCTPEQLPPTLLHELERWLVRNPTFLEGSARPGCVHLHFSALLSEDEAAALAADLPGRLAALAADGVLGTGAAAGALLAQAGGGLAAVLQGGRPVLSLDCASAPGALPRLYSVAPLAVTPAYTGPFLATGRGISGPQDAIFCRRQGCYPLTEASGTGGGGVRWRKACWLVAACGVLRHGVPTGVGQLRGPWGGGLRGRGRQRAPPPRPPAPPLQVVCKGPEVALGGGHVLPLEWVQLRLPRLTPGAHQVEAQRGALCSAPLTFLVLQDAAAAGELRRLEAGPMGEGGQGPPPCRAAQRSVPGGATPPDAAAPWRLLRRAQACPPFPSSSTRWASCCSSLARWRSPRPRRSRCHRRRRAAWRASRRRWRPQPSCAAGPRCCAVCCPAWRPAAGRQRRWRAWRHTWAACLRCTPPWLWAARRWCGSWAYGRRALAISGTWARRRRRRA